MTNKRGAAAGAAAGTKGDDGAMVYIGPSIHRVAQSSTAYKNGLTPKLKEALEREPILKSLLVPASALAEARRELGIQGSGLSLLYKEAEERLGGAGHGV